MVHYLNSGNRKHLVRYDVIFLFGLGFLIFSRLLLYAQMQPQPTQGGNTSQAQVPTGGTSAPSTTQTPSPAQTPATPSGATAQGPTGQQTTQAVTGPPPILEIAELETGAEGEKSLYAIELRDVEIGDFLRVLARNYKLNIFINNKVQGTITASLSNVSLEEALETIIESNNLVLQKKGNILKVSPNLITKMYVLKYLDASTLVQAASSTGSTGTTGTTSSTTTGATGAMTTGTTSGSSGQGTTAGQFRDIFSLLSSDGKILLGQQPNSVMIIDYPPNVQKIEEYLNMADQRITSKAFKLNFLNASEIVGQAQATSTTSTTGTTGTTGSTDTTGTSSTTGTTDTTSTTGTTGTTGSSSSTTSASSNILGLLSSIGKVLYGVEPNSILVIDYPENIKRVEEYLSVADVLAEEVLIEARVLEVDLEGEHALGINWDLLTRKQDEIQIGALKIQSPLEQDIPYKSTTEPGGTATETPFIFEIWRKNLHTVVSMLANSLNTNLLSAPSIVTVNNRSAYIDVVQRLPWPEPTVSTVTVGSETLYAITWEINWEEVGITLDVLPTITPNGDIAMTITPEVSEHTGDYPLTVVYGTQNINYSVPIIDKRKAQTKIIVRDGETLIIGGLIKNKVEKAVTKLPILGDIPIVGAFFRSENTAKEKIELLILISPTIIRKDAYERAYREEKYGRGKWYIKEKELHDRLITTKDAEAERKKKFREYKEVEKDLNTAVRDATSDARESIDEESRFKSLEEKYKRLLGEKGQIEEQIYYQQEIINTLEDRQEALLQERKTLEKIPLKSPKPIGSTVSP